MAENNEMPSADSNNINRRNVCLLIAIFSGAFVLACNEVETDLRRRLTKDIMGTMTAMPPGEKQELLALLPSDVLQATLRLRWINPDSGKPKGGAHV